MTFSNRKELRFDRRADFNFDHQISIIMPIVSRARYHATIRSTTVRACAARPRARRSKRCKRARD